MIYTYLETILYKLYNLLFPDTKTYYNKNKFNNVKCGLSVQTTEMHVYIKCSIH